MTYQQWGNEYKTTADIIKERIANLKKQLITASVDELRELNYRISSLYQMYLDCMDSADTLIVRKGVAF